MSRMQIKMFKVLDSGRLARYPECHVSPTWVSCEFKTFQEAFAYAKDWLGSFYSLPSNWDGSVYNYNGYGDTIEIREEQ